MTETLNLDSLVGASAESRIFARHGMWSAARFYAFKNEPLLRRAARVTRACFERTPLPDVQDTYFYPAGRWGPEWADDDAEGHGLKVLYTGGLAYDAKAFAGFIAAQESDFDRLLLQRIVRDIGAYHVNPQTSRYAHGGMHWVMNFPRLLSDGLMGYRRRIEDHLSNADEAEQRVFHEAMLDTVAGLTSLVERSADAVRQTHRQSPSLRSERLTAALEHMLVRPARSFYEALAAVHFVTYLGCGEPGRLDQYLYPFYVRDRELGVLSDEVALELLDEHFATMDDFVGSPGAWHLAIGGTNADGQPGYNELTAMCLTLNRKYRQPNTSLRVRRDMPDEIWEIALDNLGAGRGNPALVNEELYWQQLPEMGGVAEADLCDYGFGGCTETLVQGKSAVDSIGSTYNLLDVLEVALTSHLPASRSFGDFMRAFQDDIRLTTKQLVEEVNLRQACYGRSWTEPVRTLFTDDCIERAKGYHEGGARYNFEICVVYGIANVVNSLYTLKQLFAGGLGVSKGDFLEALCANYEGHETLLARVRALDKFGNNAPEINALATEVTDFVFDQIRQARCWRGNGRFLPASIGWVDFIAFGKYVGATPDGRLAGEPLADSTGPMQGTDHEGPTETLLSTAAVAQHKALGTCVLNLMLDPQSFKTPSQREKLEALILTYFAQGGGQVQINVLDREVLEDAVKHPEKHRNLFVRVAGYNDYFVKQTPEIQTEILERTRHGIVGRKLEKP